MGRGSGWETQGSVRDLQASQVVSVKLKSVPVNSTTDPRLSEHQAYAYAVTALNELMHQAKTSGMYSDRELAMAIFPLLSDELKAAHPLPNTIDRDKNSSYFHSLFNLHCRSLTGE